MGGREVGREGDGKMEGWRGESTVVLKVALFDHVMETGKIYMMSTVVY